MGIIIQKFGGTSVGTEEGRKQVVQKIIVAKEAGDFPIVVVSAMGRIGAPYATDTLLQFVETQAGKMQAREQDLLLSCGEVISAVTMATLLTAEGHLSQAFTGGQSGIMTNAHYGEADLVAAKPEALLKSIEEGVIPVVAGFQGVTEGGEVTTLGRGGSDTTAAILGAILEAERIEIYTDVDGIMTADPRVCQEANIIKAISYNEIFQMADSGAKVIHPRAVEYAMRANIPIVIKNTFSNAPGTYILQNIKLILKEEPKLITGLAHKSQRVQFTVYNPTEEQVAEELFEQIAFHHISIDLINIFPTYQVFTIEKECQQAVEALLNQLNYKYSIIEDCCKITAVGERMTGVPGVMAQIIKVLRKEKIEILQTADSLITIGCLIKEVYLEKALDALHEAFGL